MSASIQGLTQGAHGVLVAYGLLQGPVLWALARGRAPVSQWVLSPIVCLICIVVLGALNTVVVDLLGLRSGTLNNPSALAVWAVEFGAVGYGVGRWMGSSKPLREYRLYQRGAVISQPERARRFAWLGRSAAAGPVSDGQVTLAGVPVPIGDECKHFKIIGTTGTGKSTAIRELLKAALARGDRAVIADPDGGYLGAFHNAQRGDVILNPFHPGSVRWRLLAEIDTRYDIEQLARSLIPDGDSSDRSWTEYARTFFTCVVERAREAGVTEDREIERLLTGASLAELRRLVARTPAGPFLEEGNERMFGSVRSITSSAVRALTYTATGSGPPFSVRRWVREGAEGQRAGVLFLPYQAGQIAALSSMISAWMRIAIFEAMSREEADQRLWFIVDELDALGTIDGLKDALARLRKFGGRAVLGFQSIAQVSGTYGRGAADTIVENCANTLILRCSASERGGTSEFASKLIGQTEVLHVTESRSNSRQHVTRTTSQHVRIEPAVMASQIEQLPDLEGYLKVASRPDWMRVRLAR